MRTKIYRSSTNLKDIPNVLTKIYLKLRFCWAKSSPMVLLLLTSFSLCVGKVQTSSNCKLSRPSTLPSQQSTQAFCKFLRFPGLPVHRQLFPPWRSFPYQAPCNTTCSTHIKWGIRISSSILPSTASSSITWWLLNQFWTSYSLLFIKFTSFLKSYLQSTTPTTLWPRTSQQQIAPCLLLLPWLFFSLLFSASSV